MLVSDVMTSPALTVREGASLKDALAMLDQHAITMLPVVSASGAIVGVLSEADIVRDAVPEEARANVESASGDELGRQLHSVAELMTRDAVTVPATTDLTIAAQVMTDRKVKSLPALDEHGRVVGVISRRDIVRILARTDKEVVRDLDDLFRRVGTDWRVDVRDGAVIISGQIFRNESALAEAAARTVLGVRSVTVIPD